VKELASFSTLPHFFGLFIKNSVCIELLFSILAGQPDQDNMSKEEIKKWEETELSAVKF